ncbi:HAMP domain-containing histidine kinase [Siccirubricoccus sp. KC 17139]|uniref:histidine kinase n=1 Tax=Siccirubricoccus soli TaxID=2899147 RepID=A0ABT1DAV3_9PROT|nr:HAMP domain-containing sensor histidine kinase [Siccirubricoccus soli]MCO6419056.1 HAMP domain-containing histidine kinase [Siccirubricoccus soli]MCP2685191.1 HAMP domain-containing histidine kinase [Siccirubricoccus soli]
MSQSSPGVLERELAYYRRECNDLGARLLRLQEEQSQAFREARRSRTVARLIREAYRLADGDVAPEEIGAPILEMIMENTLCDGAALLAADPAAGEGVFRVTHAIGPHVADAPRRLALPAPPSFFFTTSRTPIEPPAYELTAVLRLPYVLWAYDHPSGHALIIGNQSESNVSRPFEAGDQELIEGALSVYIDVLLRKRAEVELRAAKTTAERASQARARFLATLTHELRTPLNAIIGYSEMLAPRSPYPLTEASRGDYAVQILGAGRQLLGLIDGILDYSSIENAVPALATEWVPASKLLQQAVQMVSAGVQRRDVAIEPGTAVPGLEFLVDPLRFCQVVQNLLGNAVKFSRPQGIVTIAATLSGEGAVLQVRDRGIGMRAEDIPRALEPFQQIEGSHARSFGGAGLGLPIAKALTEAHGGTLCIESVPGEGTTVSIRLPAERVRLTLG